MKKSNCAICGKKAILDKEKYCLSCRKFEYNLSHSDYKESLKDLKAHPAYKGK